MTLLQQALQTVQAPKVSLSEIRGKDYTAQSVRAGQVTQTNYAGQINDVVKAGGSLYSTFVDNSWKEAQQHYNEAEAQGIEPMKYAELKANEENQGLVGKAINAFKEGVGVDPLAYNRAVSASKQAEQQAFDIDNQLQQRIQQGHFRNMDEVIEARDEMRKGVAKSVSESLSVEPTNAYLVEGLTRNNEASRNALAATQASATARYIKETNMQTMTTNRNLLIDQGVSDPSVFVAQINSARDAGTLGSDAEAIGSYNDMLNAIADKGDTKLLNGLLNQQFTAYGETQAFGDKMRPEVRDAVILKAEEAFINKNEKLYGEFNKGLTEANIMAFSGNPAGALRKLESINGWLQGFQGSGQVTSQGKQIVAMRDNILTTQARMNIERSNRITRQAEEMVKVNEYAARIDLAQAGGLVALDYRDIDGSDKGVMDKAFMIKYDNIMASEELNPQQKQQAIYNLAAYAPKGSELYSAIQRGVTTGLDAIDSALARTAITGVQEMPQQAEQLLSQYRDNTVGFQQVVTPEQFAKVAALSDNVGKLGWDTYSNGHSKGLSMSKEDTGSFNLAVSDLQEKHNMTEHQMSVVKTGAMPYFTALRAQGKSVDDASKQAIKMAYDKVNEGNVTLKDAAYVIPAVALAPRGQQQEIPVVQAELERTIKQHEVSNTGGLVGVDVDDSNNIIITEFPTGKVTSYTAIQLADKASKETYEAHAKKKAESEAYFATKKAKKITAETKRSDKAYTMPVGTTEKKTEKAIKGLINDIYYW